LAFGDPEDDVGFLPHRILAWSVDRVSFLIRFSTENEIVPDGVSALLSA
jgi:hypothetical protein